MNEQGFSPEMPDNQEENSEELMFSEGWKDILGSPDAADYQHQLHSLIELTQKNTEWSKDDVEVQKIWQVAVEKVAYLTIPEDDLKEMTQSEIVETALITLMTNLEELGWIEEGKSFEVPDLATGDPYFFDITEPFS